MKEVINMKTAGKSKKRIGKDIMELRLALGEKQRQFATRFNVTQTTISSWERGKDRPKPETLVEISHLYDQMFNGNKKSNVSSFEKGQTATNHEKIDKFTLLKLLGRELLGTNLLEQYSSNELLEELTRRTTKKDDL